MTRALRLAALGLALLLTLAACSIGGSSKNTTHPTATTSTTIKLESSPTATLAATSASTPAAASTPVVATPAAAGPKATPATGAPAKASPAASPVASPGATPASSESPVVTSCSPANIPPFTGSSPNYTVSEQGLNFRAGPGTDCATLGDPLDSGTAVTVLSDPVTRKGETTQWVEVQINGQDGWVAADFIQPAQ